jgi:hypothetical protein
LLFMLMYLLIFISTSILVLTFQIIDISSIILFSCITLWARWKTLTFYAKNLTFDCCEFFVSQFSQNIIKGIPCWNFIITKYPAPKALPIS